MNKKVKAKAKSQNEKTQSSENIVHEDCAKTKEFHIASSDAAKKTKNRKRRSKRLPLIVTLICVCVLLCGALVASAFVRFGGSTIWEILGSLRDDYRPSVDTNVPIIDPNKSGEDTYHPDVTGYNRKEGVYNFLIGGMDRISNLTDVLMIVTLDTEQHSIHVTQIPRDLYFDNGGQSASFHKINSYFLSILNTLPWDMDINQKYKESAARLTEFFKMNFGIQIDGYAFTTLDGFREIVDIFDGVEVDVPIDMYYNDSEQGLYINLKKGTQVLDGNKAEQFIRFRYGFLEGDMGRVKAQKIFLSAFVKKIKTELTVSRLINLMNAAMEHVVTSISAADCVYYAKEVFKVDMSSVTFFTLSGEASFTNGASYYVLNRADGITVMNALHNVYEAPVTSSIFDRNRVFTDSSNDDIYTIYDASPTKDLLESLLSATKINNDSIDIPHY